jgi:recombination protein RecA
LISFLPQITSSASLAVSSINHPFFRDHSFTKPLVILFRSKYCKNALYIVNNPFPPLLSLMLINSKFVKNSTMADANEAKKKALQLTLDKLDKTYGKGAVMKMGDKAIQEVEVISSGSIGLDLALGVGGYPRGRVIEIYGPESSGKTTLTLHAIAECQKAGGIAAFIDAEHAFDRFYAEKLGVDISELIISQPDHGEQALEIADNLIRSGAIDIVVIDSVAALTPKSEIEGEMGDSKMGLHARLMSQALRKLTGSISKTNCTVFFINQLREKIGVMFGNPETTTGGNALKFYASVRLDIRRSTQIKNGEAEVMGNKTRVKVVKNKVAPPFRTTEFDIMYGEGISKIGEIIDLGVNYEIIKKSGSWFSYGDTKLGQGRDAVKELLEDNLELMEELETKIMDTVKAVE